MIFVTVGTHEQQFNRLVEYVDQLKGNGIIQEEVIMQTGFSTYEPKFCKWQKLFKYEEMMGHVREARIVITHGGPSSFMMALQIGKIPIVVPRLYDLEEHVNNHQLDFAKYVAEKEGNIICVENIAELESIVLNYEVLSNQVDGRVKSNNSTFNQKLEEIVNGILINN